MMMERNNLNFFCLVGDELWVVVGMILLLLTSSFFFFLLLISIYEDEDHLIHATYIYQR